MRNVLTVLAVVLFSFVTALAEISVTAGGDVTTVYIENLDLLRQRYDMLRAEIRVGGETFDIDLTPAWQSPAVLVRARGEKVSVTLRGDGGVIEGQDQDVVVNVAQAEPRIALTDTAAEVEIVRPGVRLPVIHQPDLGALQPIALDDAPRELQWNNLHAQVTADICFPSVASNNHAALTRQTARPDDPTGRSIYVPLQSMIREGDARSRMNYLAEVPLDPAWLDGEGDKTYALGPHDIRVHATDERYYGTIITGQSIAGLAQASGSMTLDQRGNIYYSVGAANRVVRFDVHAARFEMPPIDMQQAVDAYLPTPQQMPEELRGKRALFDNYVVCAVADGRLIYMPMRYVLYNVVILNGVFSLPLDHWDDAERFRAEMKLIARSWPGSDLSLYDFWPHKGMVAGNIAPGVMHAGEYHFASYTPRIPGGPWRVTLNSDGSGAQVNDSTYDVWEKALKAEYPAMYPNASGLINWWDYGVLTVTRAKLHEVLYGKEAERPAYADGTITVYYDAIAAMRTDPSRYAALLAAQEGPSEAACRLLIGVPDESGKLIGVGEKSYYLASYDVSRASEGVIRKRYLPHAGVPESVTLPVKAGLGPYGRVWWRDSDDLYLVMIGYTGVASMRYRSGDRTLETFESVRRLPPARSLDGAPTASFLRERWPVLGMDGRVYHAGYNVPDRGGNAYSSGLSVFTPPAPDFIGRVAHFSRTREVGGVLTRIIHEPNGGAVQQFILAGDQARPQYLEQLDEADRPANLDAQLLVYDVRSEEEPKAVMGFSLPIRDGRSGIDRHILSRDRRYEVSLQHGCLLVFDLAVWRYVDGMKIDPDTIWYPSDPETCFIQSPDDRTFLCMQPKDAAVATFYELNISPAGVLSLRPHLSIRADDAKHFDEARRGVFGFTPDENGDGSYDLCIGPYWRHAGSTMWFVPDFIQPRSRRPHR